ncbi:cystatin-A1-like [Vombatus ursinus]|uniref:Cystatin domain-containing protein n=1 Tax=Vombatus ursinus TaxID=29139 RepID=A0A4X2KDY3_VOMUR|nr:cystatin-A1-like [Vombatus ursinus]
MTIYYMTILYICIHELIHGNSSSISFCKPTTTKMMPGGLSETKSATPEIQKIVDEVKPQLEKKSNEKYDHFEAVKYRTQVVAGTMYFIKVHTGGDQYVHLKVFRPLPYTNDPMELSAYQTGKTKDDELTYF